MIHDAILDHVQDALQAALIDDIPLDDPTRGGVVIQGALQGAPDPDPDQARISITLYENDPDAVFDDKTSSMKGDWQDEIAEIECGGSATWKRRFTVKARCLLANTGEDRDEVRRIASVVRSRIEHTLLHLPFRSVKTEDEYVSRGVFSESLKGEMVQAGGPPDAYDYYLKVRFEVQTTTSVGLTAQKME